MCERERSIYRRRERARDRIFILLLTPYAIHLPMIMEPFARRGSARRSLFFRRLSAASTQLPRRLKLDLHASALSLLPQ